MNEEVRAVVVAYDSAEDLPTCLASLAALGVPVTVVDNASRDDSAQVAEAAGATVIRAGANLGFGKAVNLACLDENFNEVSYLLLMNPDAEIGPLAYRALLKALQEDLRLAAVVPAMRYPDGTFGIPGGPKPSVLKEWLATLRVDELVPRRMLQWAARRLHGWPGTGMLAYFDEASGKGLRELNWVSAFCLLIRADAFREVGGFDPGFFLYYEDVDLSTRLRDRGWRVACATDVEALHVESTSTGKAGKGRLYAEGFLTYFVKHGSRWDQFWARLLKGLWR